MTGQSRLAVRAWVLPLMAVVLVFGATSFVRRSGAERPILGVQWIQSSAGPLALSVDPDGEAWASGLREGDVLLQAAGRPVDNVLDASTLGWELGSGAALELRVRRGASELELRFLPQVRPRPEPYPYLSVVGLAFWFSGLFIALRGPIIRGGLIYTLLTLCLFAQLTLSHTGSADRLDWAIYWADVVAGSLAPALMLHLAIAVTRSKMRIARLLLGGAYAVSVGSILAAVWLSPAALGGAYHFRDPIRAVELRDRSEPLMLALSLALTVLVLFRSYERSSSTFQRGQRRWLLWGLAGGLGPFVLLYAVPWSLGATELPTWAQFVSVVPMLFVPAACTAALARYRLHDLDLLMLRGFAEVTSVLCAFGVYASTVFLLREGVNELFPLSRSAARYIGVLAMAVSYPTVRSWVRAGVERAFYRKRYSYRATLLDWARELNAETDLSSLMERLRIRIRETLGVAEAEVLVRTAERSFTAMAGGQRTGSLELDDASVERLRSEAYIEVESGSVPPVPQARYLFALKVKDRLRAVLAIAERLPPEEPLTTEDRALLGTLAAHAATSIEAARLVSEVRRRADEIEQLHARQAKILESSAVGLLLLDAEGRIQAWNRALEEIYGLAREEALGRSLREVFPLHVVRRIRSEVGSGGPSADARIYRLGLANRRGQRLLINLAISPVDADGATVVTFDDVSERVKLEEQLLRHERLASLGLLAAGVAHEINTPLTGISSYAQMLIEECPADDPRRPLLEKIEAQTRRASKITGSLLNLARPESNLEPLDLNEAIRDVLQLFEPQIRRGGVDLRVDLAEDLPTIRGDRGKLQQVLLNLLINARDALEGQGTIELSSTFHDGKVVVDVQDSGTGISDEDLPRIFDPFFSTKGRGKGTGLGLSISYGIVQEHEGEIHVDSRPGELTRFRLELPVVRSTRAMAR